MPVHIGMRYPVNVGLAGDAKATLKELLPLLQKKQNKFFLEIAQDGMKKWNQLIQEQGTRASLPMKPHVPVFHLSSLLHDDAIVLGDAGTVAYWIGKNLTMRRGQLFSISSINCTMASAISYGIGAQVAFPGRQVVVLAGDGATTMALGYLLTLAQYKLPIKLLVFKNNTLAMEKWEQMLFMGHPEFGNDLFSADFVKIAEGCGIQGVRIDDPVQCQTQLKQALAMNEPVLIECVVDPNEPALKTPLPSEHAESYRKALENSSYQKEAIANELKGNLEDMKGVMPKAINEQTDALLKTLR